MAESKRILTYEVTGEALQAESNMLDLLKAKAVEAVDFLGEGHLHGIQAGETLRVSFDVVTVD